MQLWTPTHAKTLLPAIIVMLLLGALLRLTLGKKDLKIRMIPFQIVASLLFILELGKQGLSLYQGYDLYCLPFHFCSLFLFNLPAMAFYRGKHQKTVSAITSAVCASLFLLMLIYPALIYSAGNIQEFFTNYFSFHTVAFHNIVMLAFLLIVALDLHEPAPKGECKANLFFTIGFCIISASMAQLLQTNYANYYSCNIAPLEAVRVSLQSTLGYGLTQILYILIVSALNVLFVQLSYWTYRLLRFLVALPARKKVSAT
jgi:hypothetical protein